MGCSFSSTSKQSNFKNLIRIVHMNGYTEEIDYPVTVSEVTGNPPKHFLVTHTQLLSSASTPLKSDTLLEKGRLYFLLPYSLFDSTVSPVDLAPIARKLASGSKKSKSRKKNNSPVLSSSSRSFNLNFSDKRCNKTGKNADVLSGMQQKSPKSKSWKPVLSTIRERSFNRRSESDFLDTIE